MVRSHIQKLIVSLTLNDDLKATFNKISVMMITVFHRDVFWYPVCISCNDNYHLSTHLSISQLFSKSFVRAEFPLTIDEVITIIY